MIIQNFHATDLIRLSSIWLFFKHFIRYINPTIRYIVPNSHTSGYPWWPLGLFEFFLFFLFVSSVVIVIYGHTSTTSIRRSSQNWASVAASAVGYELLRFPVVINKWSRTVLKIINQWFILLNIVGKSLRWQNLYRLVVMLTMTGRIPLNWALLRPDPVYLNWGRIGEIRINFVLDNPNSKVLCNVASMCLHFYHQSMGEQTLWKKPRPKKFQRATVDKKIG